ncbi:DUF86 domain-containing protein [Candidatus Poribacteria bacterium]|nr:MAG: DUF86 domain-containing protein [Candidatus Poribacteria bacterium]
MLERLQRLEENVVQLRRFRETYSEEDVRRDRHLEWALRYGLLEAIQIVIDVSCYLVSRDNLGVPSSYRDCIELLWRAGYISDSLAEVLLGMVGLRNILVHEYIRVDVRRLYGLLDKLDDFKTFAREISFYLKER